MQTKFRGFRKDGKGWVEGYYYKNHRTNQHAIKPNNDIQNWDDVEVEPTSVGQFVGLTDKNGKEIYGSVGEKGGDIVRKDGKTKVVIETNQEINDPYHETGNVIFENGAFQINWVEGVNSWFGKYPHQELLFRNCEHIEIIGNQYQQP